MLGKKTGGRVKGVSKNKPKVAPSVPTPVAAGAVAAGGGGAAPRGISFATRARAKDAARPTGLKVRYELLDDLEDYEYNANEHPPEQIAEIERLLTKYGWTTAMAKGTRGVLIYGHGRRRAARNLRDRGVSIPGNPDPNRGPVVDLSHLSKAEQRAYRLADNESARKAKTNKEALTFELGELRLDGFDLSFTGLDIGQLSALGFGDDGGSGGSGNGPGAGDPDIDAKVCCPECGHEFPTIAKAFRRIAAKRPKAEAVAPTEASQTGPDNVARTRTRVKVAA